MIRLLELCIGGIRGRGGIFCIVSRGGDEGGERDGVEISFVTWGLESCGGLGSGSEQVG